MKGKVYLVGAGPGDTKLMTLKGLECIKKSDVIIYDRLANDEFLKEAKEDCEFIYVGKKSSNHILPQDMINEVIAKKALEGKIVTRLKGGDPYVFGRGGEEAEVLYDEGIDFEIVPGITSAIGGLCYAGIPITHRDYASSFHVITGHLREDEDKEINWNALANCKGTLVFLMGIGNLKHISDKLIEEGRAPKTPVAFVSWATRYNQRTVVTDLENAYEVAQEKKVKAPSLIVVGDVVKVRDKLNFFENRDLFGKKVVVTRARKQSSDLSEKINSLGGKAVELPVIKIEKNDDTELRKEIENLRDYTHIVFTSRNGVELFFETLDNMGLDSRVFFGVKVCSIGAGTSEELMKRGIKADIVPERFVAESLFEEMKKTVKSSNKILIPRSENAREFLADKLKEICEVKEVFSYKTVIDEKSREIAEDVLKSDVDYVTFTSSSTVKNLVEIAGENYKELLEGKKLVSIGPVTSRTIEEFGLEIYKEAEVSTIQGVMDVLIGDR